MALETFLIKLKSAISPKPSNVRSSPSSSPAALANSTTAVVGVLSFEIARLMSKLLHLWQSLSDSNVVCLRDQCISLEGVRKIVSNDESFLLSLACAELADGLAHAAKSVGRMSRRCTTPSLRSFHRLFQEFADLGRDPYGWVMSCKDMDAKNKKMERYVNLTTALYREMEELTMLENAFKKHSSQLMIMSSDNEHNKELQRVMDLQQKIQWQRQQVKYLKDRSLWSKSFDTVIMILARSVFTTLSRLRSVFFGFFFVGGGHVGPTSLPRSLSSSSSSSSPASSSALVHPSVDPNTNNGVQGQNGQNFKTTSLAFFEQGQNGQNNVKTMSSFFERCSKLLKPPETTLGASALALHYANLIVVMEKMIKQPHLVGLDARDDMYGMLPESVRSSLRSRLKGVGFTATDSNLAAEWKSAVGRILGWLLPLAQNMIKWQSERSFEQQNMAVKKTNANHVMLVQTLVFADRDKTEAAITELLVGLNYIWRFEREMTAKALFNDFHSPPPT